MKLIRQKIIGSVGIVMVAGMLMTPADSDARRWGNGGKGNGTGIGSGLSAVVMNQPAEPMSAEEEVGLIKMREEEKLARDVYQVLYEKWNSRVFRNIAESEQRHMDSVKVVLDKYSMVDPVLDSSIGLFTDYKLQELYNSLVEQGSQSLVAAFEVGATIEDLDLNDLYDLLAQTENSDIKSVYQNLAKGSRNHLRSFNYQLSLQGVTYEAQFLTAEQVNDIITSPRERGRVDENGEQVSVAKMDGRNGALVGCRFLVR